MGTINSTQLLRPITPNQFLDKIFTRVLYEKYFSINFRLQYLVRLSVPEQVIDWKDSFPKLVDGDVKPYPLTNSAQ